MDPSVPLVVGLDIGTKLGWAAVNGSNLLLSSGCRDLAAPSKAPHIGARFLALQEFLRDGPIGGLLARHPDPFIVYEDVRSHSRRGPDGKAIFATQAAHIYGGILAIVAAWAAARAYPMVPIGVGEWKADLGLRGSGADKASVTAAIYRLGHRVAKQDEADAIGVAIGGWLRVNHSRRTGQPIQEFRTKAPTMASLARPRR